MSVSRGKGNCIHLRRKKAKLVEWANGEAHYGVGGPFSSPCMIACGATNVGTTYVINFPLRTNDKKNFPERNPISYTCSPGLRSPASHISSFMKKSRLFAARLSSPVPVGILFFLSFFFRECVVVYRDGELLPHSGPLAPSTETSLFLSYWPAPSPRSSSA